MLISILLLTAGLVLLIKGADWLISGASALAKKYHVSDLVIGLTIVAFGTSAPELVVNTFAAFEGHSDIVFGNVIGSNLFNLFVILGISGIIMPLAVHVSTVWKEIPFSLLAVFVLFLLVNDHFFTDSADMLSRFDGILLLIMFGIFLFYIYYQIKNNPQVPEEAHKNYSGLKLATLIIIGLGALVAGGKLVVNSAVEIATVMGVSEKIIALTIVAAGTSLPELATSVVAAVKRKSDIAVGNIIGSNVFNIFLILSVSSIIRPVSYNISFNTDLYLLTGGTLLLVFAMFTGKRHKLDRWEAILLLLAYVIYTFFLLSNEA